MDPTNINASAAPSISGAAISALHRGNKIEAIKIVRAERDIGLKEAKDAVEDYVRGQPALQSSLATAQAETKRTTLAWVAAVILAVLAFYFLTRR